MGGIKAWFHKLWDGMKRGWSRFMQGRYGSDKLNSALIWMAFGAFLISSLIPVPLVKLIVLPIYYGLLGWAVFRMLSRNTYKRYRENCRYLRFLDRLRDREHKYFDCPRCHQPVRVPRGKGKIAIHCPKCQEKFIRKT